MLTPWQVNIVLDASGLPPAVQAGAAAVEAWLDARLDDWGDEEGERYLDFPLALLGDPSGLTQAQRALRVLLVRRVLRRYERRGWVVRLRYRGADPWAQALADYGVVRIGVGLP
jgi:hypothetical protein